jgi:hypothetical protein
MRSTNLVLTSGYNDGGCDMIFLKECRSLIMQIVNKTLSCGNHVYDKLTFTEYKCGMIPRIFNRLKINNLETTV